MPRHALFRQEVFDARAVHWLGAIRIAQPIGDGIAAALAVLVIVIVASFAIFGSYTRRATVPGLLEPVGGTLRLVTPAAGTVLSVHAVEGRHVAAGELLFVLSGERVSSSGGTQALIATQLATRRETLERDLGLAAARHESRVRATRERLAGIDVEMRRLEEETAVNASRRRIARANVERFEALARTGFVSQVQAQARLDDALVLEAQQAGLQRLAANLGRERNGLSSQIDDSRLQFEAERVDTARAQSSLEQERTENEARRTTVVVAPNDAIVTGLTAHAGQVVAAGGLLVSLIPEGAPLEAILYATTRQAGFVERGQRVRLRYAAYPYQKFGLGEGVVDMVELSPYAPQELPAQVAATLGPAVLQAAEPVYRIVVRIDAQSVEAYGQARRLRPGMVFEADVIQDRRRLIEWLLEPLYGLAGR
ncbi:MAG: HlyD family efflux transporter periplasmic adaptor subunit [Burkholderiaceae bacterium]